MSTKTKIEWCDSTVNFWSGCTKVSPGCANCYAEALSDRKLGNIGKWGLGAKRTLHESAFKMAHRLNRKPWVCEVCGSACAVIPSRGELHPCYCCAEFRRRRIFSLSLGDWLDPEIPAEWLARMLDTIRVCTEVRWLLLTKRPELWKERMREATREVETPDGFKFIRDWYFDGCPPSNVWIGTSIEDQASADARIPALLRIPAAGRFLSCEPLLGPIDLNPWLDARSPQIVPGIEGERMINWLIIGGESGPKARQCDLAWIRSLVLQGKEAGVQVFVKQDSGPKPGMQGRIDDKTCKHKEFPNALQ